MTANTFRVAHLAHETGIDAKRARASLRRAMKNAPKTVPPVVIDDERVAHGHNDPWVFRLTDRARVARIIMNDAQYTKFMKKAEKVAPTPEPVAA
jgi:hypothetical protein